MDFRTEGAASTIKFTCLVESRLRSTIVNDFECVARPKKKNNLQFLVFSRLRREIHQIYINQTDLF